MEKHDDTVFIHLELDTRVWARLLKRAEKKGMRTGQLVAKLIADEVGMRGNRMSVEEAVRRFDAGVGTLRELADEAGIPYGQLRYQVRKYRKGRQGSSAEGESAAAD